MNKKLLTLALAVFIGLAIAAPNDSIAGNLPETPITKILSYKNGLGLSDTQTKQLTLINNNIVNQMLQIRSQASMHKSEIDDASWDWSNMNNPQIKSAVREYFKCQADMKNLEFEAMAKASQVLSEDQIRKFNDLATIELIMVDMERDMAQAY